MKEATGSTITLFFILVGIVVTIGYLAFNINYTKAFRMKDKIIAIYNDKKGNCDNVCEAKIEEYAKKIGYYNNNSINCDGYSNTSSNGLYCYSKILGNKQTSAGAVQDEEEEYYYKISTKIYLEIPIISNVLNFRIFYITGDTKLFKKES